MRIASRGRTHARSTSISRCRGGLAHAGRTNDGDILVAGVDGDIEVDNTNGGLEPRGVSGTVVAHALNPRRRVAGRRLGKPMSFSSLNGDIDVTPAVIKATLRLESGQGDIYSDFNIDMAPSQLQQTVEDTGAKGGKFKVKVEKAMVGRINGGRAEIKFKTFNGDIHIRRAK